MGDNGQIELDIGLAENWTHERKISMQCIINDLSLNPSEI